MTLTAFNRARREAAERQRRQAVIVAPKPEPSEPTDEELAAQAAEAYAKSVRKLNKDDLVAMATERGIDTAGLNKPQLVEALVTIGPVQEPADEGDDEGSEQAEGTNDDEGDSASPESTQESE